MVTNFNSFLFIVLFSVYGCEKKTFLPNPEYYKTTDSFKLNEIDSVTSLKIKMPQPKIPFKRFLFKTIKTQNTRTLEVKKSFNKGKKINSHNKSMR